MRVLVTGGAGYIGSHTVDQLIQAGHQILILDNLSTGHKNLLHPQADFVNGDIRDEQLVVRLLAENKIESIVHFAALTGVADSLRHPDKYYDNNFGGTLNLLKSCEGSRVRFFVFSSTAAVYQDPGQSMVTEESATGPITPYGVSKLMSEKMIQESAHRLNLKFMILRYFNVAGASESNQWGQYGVDSSALIKRVAQVASGQLDSISIFGTDYPTFDGTAIRDFIHVEDLAELHVRALEFLKAGGKSDILNCGYGHGFSVREVIQTMKDVSGQDFKVREEKRRPGDLAQVVTANDKVRETLNWRPKRDNLKLICKTAYEWEMKYLCDAK